MRKMSYWRSQALQFVMNLNISSPNLQQVELVRQCLLMSVINTTKHSFPMMPLHAGHGDHLYESTRVGTGTFGVGSVPVLNSDELRPIAGPGSAECDSAMEANCGLDPPDIPICGYSKTKPATATSRGSHGDFLSCITCLGLPYLQPRGIPSSSSRMPHWYYNMPYSPMSSSSATAAAPTFCTFTRGAGRWCILTKVDFIETTFFFVQIQSMLCNATVVVWCYIPNEDVLNSIIIHALLIYDLQKHFPLTFT